MDDQRDPQVTSQDQYGTLELSARTLPPPAGASDALRDAIAASADGVAARLQQLAFVPKDDTAWLSLIDADNQRKLAELEPVIATAPVSVDHAEIAGVDVYQVVPDEIEPSHKDHLFVHVHGGAWILNSGLACVGEALAIALGTGMPAVSIDYRMPPQHPSPAAVDDVVAVFQALREDRRAGSMAMGGSSAGGNVTLCAVQRLIELGASTPGALYVGTPAADLNWNGDTTATNQGVDRNISTPDGTIAAATRLYAGKLQPNDPRVSPIYGSFDGFPPTLLVTGTRDLLLSDTARTHIKLREAGAKADLLVYEGMSHADYLIETASPESQHFIGELDRFFATHLRSSSRRSSEHMGRMRTALDLGLS
jgi:acetyl esterase/lipase